MTKAVSVIRVVVIIIHRILKKEEHKDKQIYKERAQTPFIFHLPYSLNEVNTCSTPTTERGWRVGPSQQEKQVHSSEDSSVESNSLYPSSGFNTY